MTVIPTDMPQNLKNYGNFVLGHLESGNKWNMFERGAHMGFGYTQWSGSRALTLMRRILAESATFFDDAPTPEKTYVINNSTSVWTEGYQANDAFCTWWDGKGGDPPSPGVQVQLSKEDFDGYLQYLVNQNIIFGDWKCVIGFITLMHWYGNGGAVKYFGGFNKNNYESFKSDYKSSNRAYSGANWKIERGNKLFSDLDIMTDNSDWDYKGASASGQDAQSGNGGNQGNNSDTNIVIPSDGQSQYGGMSIHVVSDKTMHLFMGGNRIAFTRFANNMFCNGTAKSTSGGGGGGGGGGTSPDTGTVIEQPPVNPITPLPENVDLQAMADVWSTMVCDNYTMGSNRQSFGNWLETRHFSHCDCSSSFGLFYKHFFGVLATGAWTEFIRDSAPVKHFLSPDQLRTEQFQAGDGIVWVNSSDHSDTVHVDMVISSGVGTTARIRGFGTAPYSYAWINDGKPTLAEAIGVSGNRYYAWRCRFV